MCRILDRKYEKADLNKVMDEQCQHLTSTERYRLLHILKKFEYLFGGTLGTWDTNPLYLELKDKSNPIWSQPYTLPIVHEVMFRKEVEILVSLGVLK